MLSIGSGKAWYYANLAQKDDYYQQGTEAPGLWYGRGAHGFGLSGEVAKQDFYALCAGYDPRSAEKLVHHAGTERRRALWDFTFSAPKGVSVWWGMTDEKTRERLTRCQLRAVTRTLDYVEEKGLIGTRRGGSGKEIDPCHKLTWALYEHSTSREQDAELHTHAVLINVGFNQDGQTRTLDPAEAVRGKMLFGAIYRAELSRQLQQEFGVEVERLPKGMFDIKGVPEDLKADHSRRRQQILDAMGREGATGAKAASAFVLTTRKVKEYRPREELFVEWAERGREYGLDEQEIVGRREFTQPTHEQTRESLSSVIEALTKDQAYFTQASLLKGLAIEAQYTGAGFAQCRQVTEEYLERQAVYLRREKGQKLYTTPEIDQLEKRMLSEVIEGRGREFPALWRPRQVDLSGLSDEQRRAVRHLTDSRGSIKIVSGMAGAGKTTMLQSAREVWEAQGYQVRGVALAAVAAQGLENEAKIPSQTIAKLFYSIDNPQKDARPQLNARTVLVVDEAGMVGTLQMARLVNEAEKAGAKLALVGDERQLQPIEHGAPFKTFGNLLGKVELREIRRQREEWQREAVHDFAGGRAVEGLTKYLERGLLTITEKRAEAVRQLVDAWSKDPADYQDKIMMGSTRATVSELNRLGQQSRIERGELRAESVKANGYDFHVGDRILFRKNDRRLGVLNGEKASVKEIDAKSETLIARMDGGELRVIPLRRYEQVQLGYAFTTHAEQGDTREKSFVLVGGSMQDRELSYVQMSRHRAEAQIFTSIEEAGNSLETLAEVMNRSRQKELAQEKREQGIENAPAANQERREEVSQERPDRGIEIDHGIDLSM
jgi:Ti-type conjugative transfer relaxase TraA